MKADCLFCKIIEGTIPAKRVYESESVIGFVDIHPQAKKHYLFIHRGHSRDVNDMMEFDPDQVKDLYKGITQFAGESGEFKDGFRVVTNVGPHAGQTVFHTHFHLLGGEQLGHFGK